MSSWIRSQGRSVLMFDAAQTATRMRRATQGLLHRGVSTCAGDLARGLPPMNKHISSAMSVVRLFLSHGVRRVYVVVDNTSQPCVLKAATDECVCMAG